MFQNFRILARSTPETITSTKEIAANVTGTMLKANMKKSFCSFPFFGAEFAIAITCRTLPMNSITKEQNCPKKDIALLLLR